MTEIHSSRVRADTPSYCVKLLHGTRLPPESPLHSAVAFTKPGLTAGMRKWLNGVSRPFFGGAAAVTPRPFSMLKYAGRVSGAALIVAIE